MLGTHFVWYSFVWDSFRTGLILFGTHFVRDSYCPGLILFGTHFVVLICQDSFCSPDLSGLILLCTNLSGLFLFGTKLANGTKMAGTHLS